MNKYSSIIKAVALLEASLYKNIYYLRRILVLYAELIVFSIRFRRATLIVPLLSLKAQ